MQIVYDILSSSHGIVPDVDATSDLEWTLTVAILSQLSIFLEENIVERFEAAPPVKYISRDPTIYGPGKSSGTDLGGKG